MSRWDAARAGLIAAVQDGARARMTLVNCNDHGGRVPLGAVYIGRRMRGCAESPLRNIYATQKQAAGKARLFGIRNGGDPLEYYRRWLVGEVAAERFRGGRRPVTAALQQLRAGAKLACWCTSRPARVEGNDPHAQRCHGDSVYSVWLALERSEWRLESPPGAADLLPFQVRQRAAEGLYLHAFGTPMAWKTR